MDDTFRNDLRKISSGDQIREIEVAAIERPERAGWLRRPKLDIADLQIWERPDGSFVGVPG